MTLYRHEGSPEARDAVLRELGYVVVRFSHLMHFLEMSVAGMLQWASGTNPAPGFAIADSVRLFDEFNSALGCQLDREGDSSEVWRRAMVAFSTKPSTASKVAEVFKRVVEVYGATAWNFDDRTVADAYFAELARVISVRNRLMHDSWMVLGVNAVMISDQSTSSHTAERVRARPSGAQVVDVSASELASYVEDLEQLVEPMGGISLCKSIRCR